MTPTEEYFIALGFEYTDPYKDGVKWWILKDGDTRGFRNQFNDLPNIRDSFTQLKKWVIDPMEAEGYAFELNTQAQRCVWYLTGMIPVVEFQEKITNGDIPLAMIRSATRYFKSKEK